MAHRIRKPHAISGLEDSKVSISEIGSFISGIRQMKPSNPKSIDEFFRSRGASPKALACLTPLERDLIFLYSLAEKKRELSASSPAGYEPWESACYVWQSHGYQRALESMLLLANSAEGAVRQLPRSERADFVVKYNAYVNWLKQGSGNDNDPIPVGVLIDSIGSYDFPDVPKPV